MELGTGGEDEDDREGNSRCGADIERIEEFFLQKDLQTELEERRRKERENRMKEKTDEVRGKVCQL